MIVILIGNFRVKILHLGFDDLYICRPILINRFLVLIQWINEFVVTQPPPLAALLVNFSVRIIVGRQGLHLVAIDDLEPVLPIFCAGQQLQRPRRLGKDWCHRSRIRANDDAGAALGTGLHSFVRGGGTRCRHHAMDDA